LRVVQPRALSEAAAYEHDVGGRPRILRAGCTTVVVPDRHHGRPGIVEPVRPDLVDAGLVLPSHHGVAHCPSTRIELRILGNRRRHKSRPPCADLYCEYGYR